jgi:hypothetical protein
VAQLAADAVDKAAAASSFDLDALLREERTLANTRYGCLRACHITLLLLPPPCAPAPGGEQPSVAERCAAAADDAVRPFALRRLAQSVLLYGGSVLDALTEATTHLVVLPHSGWVLPSADVPAAPPSPPPTLADAEASLAARDPAQAALLRHRLAARAGGDDDALPLVAVSRGWLDARLACADAAVAPLTPSSSGEQQPLPQPPSVLHFVLPEGDAAPSAAGAAMRKRGAAELEDGAGASERIVLQRVCWMTGRPE